MPARWDDWDDWLFRCAGAIAGIVRNQPVVALDPMARQIAGGCASDLVELWRGRATLPGWAELPPGELARRVAAALAARDEGIRFDQAAASILDAALDDPDECAERLAAHLAALGRDSTVDG